MIPTTVTDLNKSKPNSNSHLLLCSFSPVGISLIKKHAAKLPTGVSFNLSVPPAYSSQLKELLKIQRALRMIRNEKGEPVVRSRITTSKGHLLLETSDRTKNNNWTNYKTEASFFPSSDGTTSHIEKIPSSPQYSLLQYHWQSPLPPSDRMRLTETLKDCNILNFSFHKSGHSLSITNKPELEKRVQDKISRNLSVATAKTTRVTH